MVRAQPALEDRMVSSEGTGGSETESRAPETFAWYHRTCARRCLTWRRLNRRFAAVTLSAVPPERPS
jgi:hypothetical protein